MFNNSSVIKWSDDEEASAVNPPQRHIRFHYFVASGGLSHFKSTHPLYLVWVCLHLEIEMRGENTEENKLSQVLISLLNE